ncbi:MAG: hypothetical protein VX293_00405 [Candidatus Latescibacterota bacterium]|nr:hypothetical protein [Candidatus Latescibacterota bacterium]
MNLLLVSIDSLRLDFAPGVGTMVRTPRFLDLARDFHLCQHCFSVSSATRPVHTSLFSGLYPFEHGIEGQRSPAMRRGFADLFELCQRAGYTTRGFSEAPEIFTGLRYADHIAPMPSDPNALSASVPGQDPSLLFLHYWSVHTPYGAADGLAFGETGRLLASGRLDLVQERYCTAIEKLCELHLAPLLAGLDLEAWSVFIISDHGESWRPDEPYHGQTLRNDVLRVPLYYHIPTTGNPPPARDLISLVDLFPTFLSLLDLDYPYRGFARDIHDAKAPRHYLAEIDPGPMADGPAHQAPLFPATNYGRQWALFDANNKFSYDQSTQREELIATFSEEPVFALDSNQPYHQAYAELRSASSYGAMDFGPGADRTVLQERLRKLGYLE